MLRTEANLGFKRSADHIVRCFGLVLLLTFAFATKSHGQYSDTAQGLSPYAHYDSSSIDNINISNGNLYLQIPLVSFPQRGKNLKLNFNIYFNDKQWSVQNLQTYTVQNNPNAPYNPYYRGTWMPLPTNNALLSLPAVPTGAYVARDQHVTFGVNYPLPQTSVVNNGSGNTQTTSLYVSGTFVATPDGTTHYYSDSGGVSTTCTGSNTGGTACGTSSGPFFNSYPASDTSGFLTAPGGVIGPDGLTYTEKNDLESIIDKSGNSIVTTVNGWTDSIGRVIPGSFTGAGATAYNSSQYYALDPAPGVSVAVSATNCPSGTSAAREWLVPSEGGTNQPYYLCYTNVAWQSSFNASRWVDPAFLTVSENNSNATGMAPIQMLTAIILPTSPATEYTFAYDSYLSLTTLGLPTGATIIYTWQNLPFGLFNGGLSKLTAPVSRAVRTKVVNPGNGQPSQTWTYGWNFNFTYQTYPSDGYSNPIVNFPVYSIVTDPAGNDVEHELGGSSSPLTSYAVETATRFYAGCSPHDNVNTSACTPSQGTLLKTVSYSNFASIGNEGADSGTPSVPSEPLYKPLTTTTSVVTSSGNITSQVTDVYTAAYGSCQHYYFDGPPVAGETFTPSTLTPCYTTGQLQSRTYYDFGSPGGSAGSALKTEKTTYHWQSTPPYLSANLLNLVDGLTTTVGTSSTQAGQTSYGYDENNGSPQGVLGNQTSVTRWLNTGVSPRTQTVFNSEGMPSSTIDAKSNATLYTYDSTGAFLSSVQYPATSSGVAHIEHYTFDLNSGQMTSHTDQNSNKTVYSYSDPLNRLTGITYPSTIDGTTGSSGQGNVSYSYNDSSGSVSLTQQTLMTGTTKKVVETFYDGLGRTIHSEITSDPNGNIVDTSYDNLGRVSTVSNPHATAANGATDGTTTYTYDALSRVVAKTHPDRSATQWCYNGLANAGQTFCQANKSSKTTATWTDSSDENGNFSQRVSDSLGRLTAVMEADPVKNTTTLETGYAYDALNNLVQVDQWGGPKGTSGERQRVFTYDSLSRLLTAKNPESGTVCYGMGSGCAGGYDLNGNLQAKTDARGIVTTYAYDTLDRITSKHYSDNTPTAYFAYDTNILGSYTNNPIGRLVDAWTSLNPSSTATQADNDPQAVTDDESRFDALGRSLVTYKGTAFNYGIPGGVNTTGDYGEGGEFAYDLAGNLVQTIGYETLANSPEIVLDYGYDPVGRLNAIKVDSTSSGLSTSLPKTLFQATSYTPVGLTAANLALNVTSSAPAISLSQAFNNRLWQTSWSYLTGSGATSGSGVTLYSAGSPSLTYDSVGNVKNLNDTVIGGATAYYDHMNRLQSIQYSSGTCNGLVDTWIYSVFGNRFSETFSGSAGCSVPNSPALTFNSNSQITNNGYVYDASGNVTSDGVNNYAYDAESRLCAYHNGLSNAYGVYVYGADGTRVLKGTISPSSGSVTSALCNVNANSFTVTTNYTFDPSGNILQEFSGGVWQENNVFAGSKLLATYSGTGLDFTMNDWLGTKRAQITSDGNVSNLLYFSSFPFGNGYSTIGKPATATDLQFTGKEQDAETNNNIDFGARYYSSRVGRFLSPDFNAMGDDLDPVPYADLNNPQSLNLYTYVQNNPLSHKDADGHKCDTGSVGPDGIFTFHCTNDPPPNPNGTVYQLAGALGVGFAPETGGASLGIAAGFAGAMFAAEYLAAHPIHLSSSNEPAPTTPGTAPSAPVPSGLVGTQDGKSGQAGGRHNSGPLDPAHGGSGDAASDFNTLTGGKVGPAPAGSNYPPGTQVGDNGISLRPARGNSGPRIDIPANGDKPHETLHYPN